MRIGTALGWHSPDRFFVRGSPARLAPPSFPTPPFLPYPLITSSLPPPLFFSCRAGIRRAVALVGTGVARTGAKTVARTVGICAKVVTTIEALVGDGLATETSVLPLVRSAVGTAPLRAAGTGPLRAPGGAARILRPRTLPLVVDRTSLPVRVLWVAMVKSRTVAMVASGPFLLRGGLRLRPGFLARLCARALRRGR